MARKVRGEQPLPGATERLLQATGSRPAGSHPKVTLYRALSASVVDGRAVTVRALRMDPGSGLIVPSLLDTYPIIEGAPAELTWVLRYWAEQMDLDERFPFV
jgi:hypothetical protein